MKKNRDGVKNKSVIKRVETSRTFAKAKRKSSEYAKNPEKLIGLVNEASEKASSKHNDRLAKVLDSLRTLFRLLKAYAKKEYTIIPWQSLLLIIATIVYFVIPVDVIPDIIPIAGFIDDAALVGWTIRTLKSDIDDFKEWENRQPNRI